LTINQTYFFWVHDIESFRIASIVYFLIQLIAGIGYTKILYGAGKQVQDFLSDDATSNSVPKPMLISGLNESLYNGKGAIHRELQVRRVLITDACKKLEKEVKMKMISWGVLNTISFIALLIAVGATWNKPYGLGYGQYVVSGLLGFSTVMNQHCYLLPRAKPIATSTLAGGEATLHRTTLHQASIVQTITILEEQEADESARAC